MEAKEEIRSRLNIEDVIAEYVQLKRAGRNYKGLSPFSNERTPSFMVSPDKHIWHDFSSNKGGDIFAFIMEVEGLDFRAALELLARKAGVDLSQFQTKGEGGLGKKKERLYGALELAVRFYQQCLVRDQAALEYVFKKRRLSKQVVADFKLGYAPQTDDALYKALTKRGYTQQELRDAGLVVTRRGRPGDMFRHRMVVPLGDGQGRIVGFTARLVDDQPDAPKYINTPQTLLYDKGRQVFGLHLAKEAIRKADYAVVVEGNLDVVSSHQAGVAQVVAAAGTALTEFHLRSLSRLTRNIRLALDGDRAGIAATERAIGIASKLELQLGIINLPGEYKDPDELIQADAAAWLAVTQNPQDAMEWLLDRYAERYNLQTAEGKRQATTQALAIIKELSDPVEQEHYLQLLAGRTATSLASIQAKMQGKTGAGSRPDGPSAQNGPAATGLKASKAARQDGYDPNTYQDELLALTLQYPQLRDALLKLEPSDFAGSLRQAVADLLHRLQAKPLTSEIIDRLPSDDLRVKIKEIQLIAEQKYQHIDDTLYFEASDLSKRVLRDKKTKQKDEVAAQMMAARDDAQRQALHTTYRQLVKEIQQLKPNAK